MPSSHIGGNFVAFNARAHSRQNSSRSVNTKHLGRQTSVASSNREDERQESPEDFASEILGAVERMLETRLGIPIPSRTTLNKKQKRNVQQPAIGYEERAVPNPESVQRQRL